MIYSTDEFRGLLKAARRAGTPLVAIRTADPGSAIAQVSASIGEQSALLIWDLMQGIRGMNKAGIQVVADRYGDSTALGPADALAAARKLEKEDAVLFVSNAHRYWDQPDVAQAIWNLRDPFKAGGQSLVLLSTPGAVLPAELQGDVMIVDEPLPSAEELCGDGTSTRAIPRRFFPVGHGTRRALATHSRAPRFRGSRPLQPTPAIHPAARHQPQSAASAAHRSIHGGRFHGAVCRVHDRRPGAYASHRISGFPVSHCPTVPAPTRRGLSLTINAMQEAFLIWRLKQGFGFAHRVQNDGVDGVSPQLFEGGDPRGTP